ncbi:MAG: xanthine dehydrogenase family protein molybdopterin-binding subunit, partial [Dehalococcoidia bacterium]
MVETPTRKPLIGSSLPKVDGVEKVTGHALFGADQRLPGMLQGAILRSPHPHANILSIDTSAAEALPGVHAVITADDFPKLELGTMVRFGAMSMDYSRMSRMIMAREKALFAGHPVAAVAATSRAVARQALDLIDVQYEVLPHVMDEVEAMAADAPLLHDDLFTSGLGEQPAKPSNVSLELEMGHGDVTAGEAAADEIVERSFKTEAVHQGYIEPEAETAWWRADGRITAWVDTQGIFSQRAQLAVFLGTPAGSIEVVPMEVGGAFGAKNTMRISPLCAGLSRKAGRPVQIVLSRDEVLRATGPGVKTTTAVRIGARKDGTITLIDARMVYNAGAFPGSPLSGGAMVGLGPYQTESLRLIGYDVVTNRPKGAAYRAPGGTPFTYGIESVIDELADKLGIDRLEFRKKNASKTGDPMPNGVIFNRIGLEDVLERVGGSSAWNDPLAEPVSGGKVGRGLALGFWRGGAGTSSCVLEVQMDGSIAVVTGSVDLHMSRTAMTSIVADEFQLPPELVRVQTGTTDTVGYTDNSGGSRVTRTTGAAVYNACQAALAILRERAADALDVTEDV